MRFPFVAVVLLVACSPSPPPSTPINITVPPSALSTVIAFAGQVPWSPVNVAANDDPVASLVAGAGLQVAVVLDLTLCAECFRVDAVTNGFAVHADGALGAEYGLATLLEGAGFRFRHPLAPTAPTTMATTTSPTSPMNSAPLSPPPADWSELGVLHTAQKTLRGIHLHTIHPIEAYFADWADWTGTDATSVDAMDNAKKINAWVVENRGNYVQWVALADVESASPRQDAWRAQTKILVDDAHARGLRVGIAVQLFKASDLQKGFDLIDTNPLLVTDPTSAIDARLAAFAGLGFDVVNVSFGEFTAIDPSVFVSALNIATQEIKAKLGASVSATIHVGGLASQQVTYMGETLQYYFLVKFADPTIDPWVHTVMYYDLFEDVGGAYDLYNFDDHKQFLLGRLAAGQSVAYFPESAYWIAFDDSVPLYLPLYVRSRFYDLSQIRAAAVAANNSDLMEHVQFSSGFEWGYWQQDRATLRMDYELPDKWEDNFAALFPQALSDDIIALTNTLHDALIGQRLAAYLAGRDAYLDTGSQAGIDSQPSRPSFDTIVAMPPNARAAWIAGVLSPLGSFADNLRTIAAQIAADADASDPDQTEVVDGAAIDAARARYIYDLYETAVAKANNGDTATPLAGAAAALSDGQSIIARRHATIPALYREDGIGEATIYPFGYLAQADATCYWQREMVQMNNLLTSGSALVPGCIF